MELTEKNRIIFISIIVVIVLISGITVYVSNIKEKDEEFEIIESEISENDINLNETNYEEEINENEKNEVKEEINEIVIHIVGSVENEGVVRLPEGSRVIDAIEKAGGEKMYADLSRINLAYVLEDGQKVIIPSIYDKEEEEYIQQGNISVENNKKYEDEVLMININKATITDLEKLPGIGTSTAEKILEYKKVNGVFESIDEIKEVSGIGDAKFNRIKEYICVK